MTRRLDDAGTMLGGRNGLHGAAVRIAREDGSCLPDEAWASEPPTPYEERKVVDMRWEDLTIANFEDAVSDAGGVCILPIGVIEAHGPHLPLSTDALIAHRVACAAAEIEPALVFPFYPWGVNVDSKAFPGGIVLKRRLILELLEDVCSEISRNGCKKIILLSGHGGNRFMLPLFVQTQLDQGIDYVPYLVCGDVLGRDGFFTTLFEDGNSGHAGECETSLMMHLAPEATHPEWIPEEPGRENARVGHLVGRLYTPAEWRGRFPNHYAGEARGASEEKGKLWLEHRATALAKIIKTVKDDQTAQDVYREYDAGIYRA